MAASTFNVMEGRVEATKREVKEEQWGLVDFLGKYHKHIIKSENPIPGTAVATDDRRERAWSDRLASIRGRIEDIEERHGANVRGRVSHATFELKAQIQKRVGSTLDRIGGVIDDIDDEVAAIQFEASGQSRRATEAEEAFERERRAKDDRVVVGDGEFEDEGALAGLSDAAKAAEAAANAMEVLGAAADARKWWGYVRRCDLFGKVAKQRKVARKPGAAAKDALEDDVDVGDSGSILLALGDARRRKAANDRRQNEASDLPPQRRAMRFSEDLPPQILPPEARRHRAFPWSMQWPPDEANKVSEVTHNDLSRLYAIINETEEAVNLQQRPLDPALVVHEEVPW